VLAAADIADLAAPPPGAARGRSWFSKIWDLSSGVRRLCRSKLLKNVHQVSTLAAASSQAIFRRCEQGENAG
jgi:hypothetical protein